MEGKEEGTRIKCLKISSPCCRLNQTQQTHQNKIGFFARGVRLAPTDCRALCGRWSAQVACVSSPAVKWQTGYEKQFTAWLCGGAYVHKLPTEKVRKTPPVVIANATAIHTGVQVHLSLRRATVARERVQERAQEEWSATTAATCDRTSPIDRLFWRWILLAELPFTVQTNWTEIGNRGKNRTNRRSRTNILTTLFATAHRDSIPSSSSSPTRRLLQK